MYWYVDQAGWFPKDVYILISVISENDFADYLGLSG